MDYFGKMKEDLFEGISGVVRLVDYKAIYVIEPEYKYYTFTDLNYFRNIYI